MLFEPAADHDGERVDIAVHGKEPLADILASRYEAAIAGPDRIDKDEVGEIEPGFRIGLHLRRDRWCNLVGIDRQPPRTGIAEL